LDLGAWVVLAAAGLLVGAIVGLTGVGGGSIMTPLLITVFGVPAPIAVGTDLANAAITKAVGTLAHGAAHNIARRIVKRLALGSVPAAILTLALLAMAHLDAHQFDRLIRNSVGVALLLSIALLLLRDPLRRWALRSPASAALRRHRPAATIVVGGAACLAMLYPDLEPVEIAGSDIAHAVPLTAVAAAGHAWLGTIDGDLLVALLVGGVPGIVLGSLLARRVPPRALRLILIATLALAGFKLLV
jgi:uncharacterized membrane protein YfcA